MATDKLLVDEDGVPILTDVVSPLSLIHISEPTRLQV